MGDRSVHSFLLEEKPIVEQFSNTLHGAVTFAQNVQNSLDDIKDNTKRLFWWSSTLVCICLGLFLLSQLVRLTREMNKLNKYQEVFKNMWQEDKEIETYRWEQEREDRRLEGLRRAAARRNKSKSPARAHYARTPSNRGVREDAENLRTSEPQPTRGTGPSPFGAKVDDALNSMPPPGPLRDEWIHELASMTQERRQAYYQGQREVEEVEEVEEDDENYWG
ncbi:uncharacterized protein F4807DRAFT_456917 [Annulohypoxylon truncatum]|uniref:uncharacterized protein n=1 Tax=Annulohypoxylon truncatum TaxID=327061 RepID=UPI0020086756|nr:uncharacterized protein F4807DRAFT_456917 [Annulohypoxylon truncatum]KAI1213573.1 hypothetical protein F4807DRAFT_456917 [Annulohypoxylon truncatum]